ncbi:cytochrome p450 [Stemphylium lycopersici]|uniref:Cytochrome p450 n=1 Tax=Stemphylium lycopersici TaxID=183478 RepID=A0A364N4Q5_STELY|nr:cytochrome p450 [Stemphylium lycopersici]
MPKPEPQLPLGTSSTIRGLSETFSFHSSPESFITSRIISFQQENPGVVENRDIVRAKVLNRNVAVVSSYTQVQQVLTDGDGFEASAAYDELMKPFFPSPNLLLMDGSHHKDLRKTWEERGASFDEKLLASVHRQAENHFSEPSNSEIDLYESMKTLSWKILLGAFLRLGPEERLFETIEGLQEDLLRGQFSLFPVTLNTGFWHSPRKKGKMAKEKLQSLMLERFSENPGSCPFLAADDGATRDIANHAVLMTSSLAVKALASLLTAFILNLYLLADRNGDTLAGSLASEGDPEKRSRRLKSALKETERLSPPIVGVMRRSVKDNIILSLGEQPDTKIPKGWDCWLYFVGANRDPAVFGNTWDTFDRDRYIEDGTLQGMAFGAGSKTCLGREWVSGIALGVAETCARLGISIKGQISARGVRGWLGWEPNDAVAPEDWARDMKQLPTQRPAEPIMVSLQNVDAKEEPPDTVQAN